MSQGEIMSLWGPLRREELGVTLPHEHILIDITSQFREPRDPARREVAHQAVGPEHRELLARNPYALRDNLLMEDVETAVEELGRFRELGGQTVVDCTSVGAGRRPEALAEVAERTGLNVIAGCGYYTGDTHPAETHEWSAARIAEAIVRDLTEGMEGTGLRAGVIGEVGTSEPLHPRERRHLEAAARASVITGAPLQVHTYPWGQGGLEALEVLEAGGADPGRVVICHADVAPDREYMREIMRRGAYVEFDDFGKEFPVEENDPEAFAGGPFATDAERVETVCGLVEEGWERQLLLTNDLCLKSMLVRYGGQGYGHVLRNIVPRLREAGLAEETVRRLVVENPADWLLGVQ